MSFLSISLSLAPEIYRIPNWGSASGISHPPTTKGLPFPLRPSQSRQADRRQEETKILDKVYEKKKDRDKCTNAPVCGGGISAEEVAPPFFGLSDAI